MRATLVFLKYPRPGRVKTRLAAALGARAAADLYRAFVEVLVEELRRGGLDPILGCDPTASLEAYRAWLGPGRYRLQVAGDLGERMRAALQEALDDGAATAVLVGTDSPHLTATDLIRAHEALAASPLVLGPARDGGYYLIGVRGAVPPVFAGVPWSTGDVFETTLRHARAAGVEPAVLERGFDVDRPEDVAELLRALPSRPHLARLAPLLQQATSRCWSRGPA